MNTLTIKRKIEKIEITESPANTTLFVMESPNFPKKVEFNLCGPSNHAQRQTDISIIVSPETAKQLLEALTELVAQIQSK
jgi:hypothetical protein